MNVSTALISLIEAKAILSVYIEQHLDNLLLQTLDIEEAIKYIVDDWIYRETMPISTPGLALLTRYGLPSEAADLLLTDIRRQLYRSWPHTVYVIRIDYTSRHAIITYADAPPRVTLPAPKAITAEDLFRHELAQAEADGDYIPERYRHL